MENENKEAVVETEELDEEELLEQKRAERKKKIWKETREWILSLAGAILAVIILTNFIFMLITVDGGSMNPTLQDRERLFVTVYDVNIYNGLERGDAVICHYPGRTNKHPIAFFLTVKTNFVKRIVGVPGDTVKRVSGVTYINDVALDARKLSLHSYTYEKAEDGTITYYRDGNELVLTPEQTTRYAFDYEYVLGEDEYFVVGDNRYNSHDCRDWNGPDLPFVTANDTSGDVGPLKKNMIVGHVRCVFWPLSEIRGIPCDPEYSAD